DRGHLVLAVLDDGGDLVLGDERSLHTGRLVGARGLRRLASLPSPYGDGTASRRIAELITRVIPSDTPRTAVPGPLVAA
ncbi:hypothetical protein ABZ488_29070, partial [Streptomyces griseus]